MNERPSADPSELQRTYRELQTPGSESCPDSEALAALALSELSGAEREGVADHVVACRRCSQDYQILARAHSEVNRSRRPFLAWAVAATLALAGAGAILVLRSPAVDETTRGAGRSVAASTPIDGATLEAPPQEFRWPPQAGAEGYRVKLFNASGDALWESERVQRDRVGLPPLERARLASGRSYFWVVEVEMPLERTRLGPFRFSLR